MKTFYLLRHEDIHGKSGVGIVAEGVIFDNGMAAMTWLSPIPTITSFRKFTDIKVLHGHEGRTEVIVEGKDKRWAECREKVRAQRSAEKQRDKE